MRMPTAGRGKVVGNLPHELTSFVGRRSEVMEARRLLAVSRLVTLTGIGGVGKTRLALRVAEESVRTFDDGVWLVELGELHDPTLVPDAVAAAVGLRGDWNKPPIEMLVDHFRDRRLLVVLDNCEHLLDTAAALADRLLRSCLHLRILATSREAFGATGEARLQVPSLSAPDPNRTSTARGLPAYDAVTLFAERARAAVPDFVVTEDNREAVAEICWRLDGLPLPIELAAARIRALAPDQILSRLTDRYRLLTGGLRGAPTRQQTLRLSVDWSYDLCSEPERALWGRLAVFAGGFELDAAEGVCAGAMPVSEVLDVLASLVDKSILIREDAGAVVRYRMLETLREYGREELQKSGGYDEIRRRHRDWYLDLAEQTEREWIGPRQLELIARHERELPNLRDALGYCVAEPGAGEFAACLAAALFPFWLSRGMLTEGRHWLDLTLKVGSEDACARHWIRALHAEGALALMQGDLDEVTVFVERGCAFADRLGDRDTRSVATAAAARLAGFSGDLARSAELFAESLDLVGADGDALDRIGSLLGLALAAGLTGDTTRAVACHEEILAITQARGESAFRAYSLCNLGLAMTHDGNLAGGKDALQQCIRLGRDVQEPITSAACIEVLAWIAAAEREPKRAAVLLGAAEALGRVLGSASVVISTLADRHADCETQVRRDLGERAWDIEYRRGAAMGLDEAVAFALDEQVPSEDPDMAEADILTRRERQVAGLVAQGLTNKAIAAELVIAQRTAQGHVEHVLAKLGFSSRTQIAAWVVEQARPRDQQSGI